MTEIEHSTNRAQKWRHRFNLFGVENHREWCVLTGLWETSVWIFDSVLIYKTMKGLNPNKENKR